MHTINTRFVSIFVYLILFVSMGYSQTLPVRFENREDNRGVDVFIGEEIFTSYLVSNDLEKPVLFPVYAPGGTVITRGYPLEPRAGERVDHPHHIGMWFNYGSVDGLDFWNNSSAIPESEKSKYGTVRNYTFPEFEDGEKSGTLSAENFWVDKEESLHLRERVIFIFSGTPELRVIDRYTVLLPGSADSTILLDNKEGLLAIRMDHAFEEPVTAPEIFTDAQGKPTGVPVLNNEGVNGVYRNSKGLTGGAVWGKRADWVALSAQKDGKKITIAMIDHPDNFGYPAHWHARGYGLFSVNNFGSRVFVPTDPEQKLIVTYENPVVLRHRIIIGDAALITDKFLNKQFQTFSKAKGPKLNLLD